MSDYGMLSTQVAYGVVSIGDLLVITMCLVAGPRGSARRLCGRPLDIQGSSPRRMNLCS
jgi:hypothetical protein